MKVKELKDLLKVCDNDNNVEVVLFSVQEKEVKTYRIEDTAKFKGHLQLNIYERGMEEE